MLRAEDIRFAYGGTPILEGVSLNIKPGSYTALIGPNGSGKTTLLSILCGFLRPRSGQVRYEGRDVHAMAPRARARVFALVQQHESANMPFTAMELTLMGLTPNQGRFERIGRADWARAVEILERTCTSPFADTPVGQLSGGEFQRVTLARALMQSPRVLLLDEAMSEMDVRMRLKMQSLLREEISRKELAIVAVHHDLSAAVKNADQVVALKGGRVACQGPADRVMTPAMLELIFGVRAEVHPGKGVLVLDAGE